MKKGLIITLYGNFNYGNKLQNYATQTFLKENGIEPETLIFGPVHRNLYRSFRHFAKVILKDHLLKSRKHKKIDKKRESNFLKFDKKIKKVTVKNLSKKYDYSFVGSDQVWNSNDLLSRQIVSYVNENDAFYISISGSVGNNKVLPKFENEYTKHFKNIKYISVREEKAKDIIKDMTGRNDIEVLLDPTMLISKENWNNILSKPTQILDLCPNNEKYILNYFLGELSNERKEKIKEFANKNNCKIINILDKNDPFYICGPDEFLWLEKNAFAIFTDSFHSSVFAILFKRPFLVFEREDKNESMNSRLQTLLNKFELDNRFYSGNLDDEVLNFDSSMIDVILEKERKNAKKFVKKILNNKREGK